MTTKEALSDDIQAMANVEKLLREFDKAAYDALRNTHPDSPACQPLDEWYGEFEDMKAKLTVAIDTLESEHGISVDRFRRVI